MGTQKNGTLRSWEGPITLIGIEFITRGRRCESCGETLFDFEEVGRQEQAIADALIKRGIRTGTEFRFVRKLAGLRANEVADMFGVRAETVSRWERDEVEVPRTAAYALGELYVHPKLTRQSFEAFAR